MFDLIAALAALALLWLGLSFGVNDAVIGPAFFAGVLTWPGYVIAGWLWPDESRLSLPQRLAFIPILSLLALILSSLALWITLQQATLRTVSMTVLIAMTVVVLVVATMRPGARRARQGTLREFGSALAMFAALAAFAGWIAPAPRAQTPTLAVYLAPGISIERDAARDVITIPLILESSQAVTISLQAETAGQVVAERRIELAPGEMRIDLEMAASALPPARAPIDIRVEAVDSAARRDLRVWLEASR